MGWQRCNAGLAWPPQHGGTARQVVAELLQGCADLLFQLQESMMQQPAGQTTHTHTHAHTMGRFCDSSAVAACAPHAPTSATACMLHDAPQHTQPRRRGASSSPCGWPVRARRSWRAQNPQTCRSVRPPAQIPLRAATALRNQGWPTPPRSACPDRGRRPCPSQTCTGGSCPCGLWQRG